MATAKKSKKVVKKPTVKRVSTAQLATEAATAAAKKPNAIAAKPNSAAVSDGANEGKRRGRPPGSSNKGKPGRKPGQKTAGRQASTEWLYIVRAAAKNDELGLPASDSPTAVDVMGPFASEETAQAAAIEQIGTNTELEVTLFKDYKRGRPEVKVRLV